MKTGLRPRNIYFILIPPTYNIIYIYIYIYIIWKGGGGISFIGGVLLRDSLTHLCMSERVKGGSGWGGFLRHL